MSDKPTQPPFHEAYDALVAGLPPSQLREAYKRLSTAKVPLTDEEIFSEHPRVKACLERIVAAYGRKKSRSAVASKVRRDAAREKPADATAPEPDDQPPQGQGEGVVEMLESCTIECQPEPAAAAAAEEPVAAEPVIAMPTVEEPAPVTPTCPAVRPTVAARRPQKKEVNRLVSRRA
jgi:hypothetical protein